MTNLGGRYFSVCKFICCHIANCPKTGLKCVFIQFLKIRNSKAAWLDSSVLGFHKVIVIWCLTGAGGFTSKVFHSHAWQVSAGCWQVALVHHRPLHSSAGVSSWSGSRLPRGRDPREREDKLETAVSYDNFRIHTVILTISYVLYISHIYCGRELYNNRRQKSVGIIYKTLRYNVYIE